MPLKFPPVSLVIGDKVKVTFMGKLRIGRIVRKGRLDGGNIQTVFIAFDDDPMAHKRNFGFRSSQVEMQ